MKTDEEQGKYTIQQDIKDAQEMLGVGYEHRVIDNSNDRKYFIITPRIVKAFARNPYDLALWDTIKDISGENGECYLDTEQLAILSGMSMGKASDCRKYWIEIGFLEGRIRKDPGYPQPVWHLTVPDLWQKNIEWCEKHPKILDRVDFMRARKSLHLVKPSPGEKGLSPREERPTPHETKKIKRKKKDKEKPIKEGAAAQPPEILLFKEVVRHYPKQNQRQTVIDAIQKIVARLGRDVTVDDLSPFFRAWGKVSGNEWSLIWLDDWAVSGTIPQSGNGKYAPKTKASVPLPPQETPEELARRRAEADRMFGVA